LLARLVLRGPGAEFLAGDLEEGFERRVRAADPRAVTWYRRQVAQAVIAWWRPEALRSRRHLARLRHIPQARHRLVVSAAGLGEGTMIDSLKSDLTYAFRSFAMRPALKPK